MSNFNLGSLDRWQHVAVGELLSFDVPEDGYRRVEFDVMAEAFVFCRVIGADDFWSVGCGSGRFTVSFSTGVPVSISFFGDPEAVVMIRTMVETQVVPESLEASFTTIEPRGPSISPELQRLMTMQRINAERREAMLRAELDAMRQAYVAPAPAPAPAPAAGVEGGADDGGAAS